jgi:hypothetical protein
MARGIASCKAPRPLGKVGRLPRYGAAQKGSSESQAEGGLVRFFRMKALQSLLKRLRGGHRPPTGPLTTSEASDAEELRQETQVKDDERMKREQRNSSSV